MNLITVEMVGKGHPDKVADQISDSILDWCLKNDSNARVAIETMLKDNKVFIAGELTTKKAPTKKDYKSIVKKVFDDVKYQYKPKIIIEVSKQSPHIAQGVSKENPNEQGAGDQGMTFGYATKETTNYMPLAYNIARALMMKVDGLNKYTSILGDGKCQVSLNESNEIVQIVVSKQTKDETFLNKEIHKILQTEQIDFGQGKTSFKELMSDNCKIYVNPTGKFEIGGPFGDTGLTGRKIIVDTYGGIAHHGGGAFSGKDLSKVDRSGALYARQIAKDIVEKDLADECEIRMDFVIGIPTALVTCSYSKNINEKKLNEILKEMKCKGHFSSPESMLDFYIKETTKDLTVKKMVESLKVSSFYKLASYGAFGKELQV